MQHRVAGQPARPRHVLWQVPQRFAVVGRVSDDVHHPVRERCGEQFDQRGGGFHFGGAGALAGQVQPGEYRQAHVAGAERQLHDDPGGDEAVAVADLARRRAASVMLPARSPDLASPPPEHRVIDRYHQVRARFHQCQDHQCGGRQAQLVNLPAGPGEEVVRAVVWPHPRQAGPEQHANHGAAPHLPGQARDQAAERAISRRGETPAQRRQHGEQGSGRFGPGSIGGFPHTRRICHRRCFCIQAVTSCISSVTAPRMSPHAPISALAVRLLPSENGRTSGVKTIHAGLRDPSC